MTKMKAKTRIPTEVKAAGQSVSKESPATLKGKSQLQGHGDPVFEMPSLSHPLLAFEGSPPLVLAQLSRPHAFGKLFDVALDTTEWTNPAYVRAGIKYMTPLRDRAPFAAKDGLRPRSPMAEALRHSFGIYILAWRFPVYTIYVGIAPDDDKYPRGILSRLRTLRTGLTSSHMGKPAKASEFGSSFFNTPEQGVFPNDAIKHGQGYHNGILERNGVKRYEMLKLFNMLPDRCSDVQIMFCMSTSNARKDLEGLRSDILRNRGAVLSAVAALFWPKYEADLLEEINLVQLCPCPKTETRKIILPSHA